jgi:hypothetical protein
MPAPPDGDRVFELLESTHRYLLTREEDAYAVWDTEGDVDEPVERSRSPTTASRTPAICSSRCDRKTARRLVPSVLFWAAILGGIAWVSARVVLGLGYLSTVRPFRSSGQWLLWAQAAETITFAVFIGASVLYVVLWISRRAPS